MLNNSQFWQQLCLLKQLDLWTLTAGVMCHVCATSDASRAQDKPFPPRICAVRLQPVLQSKSHTGDLTHDVLTTPVSQHMLCNLLHPCTGAVQDTVSCMASAAAAHASPAAAIQNVWPCLPVACLHMGVIRWGWNLSSVSPCTDTTVDVWHSCGDKQDSCCTVFAYHHRSPWVMSCVG